MEEKRTKRTLRKTLAFLLIVIAAFGLVGCAKEFDATGYVKAELDLITKHDIEQYMDVMGVSETEAKQIYEEGMSGMTASIDQMEAAGLPADLVDDYELWMIDLIVNTKYTVLEAEKSGDDYIVPVEVEPIKAFANVSDRLNEELTIYMQDMITDISNGGTQPTNEEINLWVYQLLLDIVTENLETPAYGEKQTFEITISKNSDGLYAPDETEIANLGMNLIDLSDLNDLM